MKNELIKLTDNCFYSECDDFTDRPTLGYIKGKRKAIIIDGGASKRHIHEFLDALKQYDLRAPDYCLLTHWHFDHIFGLSELDIPIISHEKTKEKILEAMTMDWEKEIVEKDMQIKNEFKDGVFDIGMALPDITFQEKMTFDLGDSQISYEHITCDHTDDSCVIYSEESETVFLGDCLYCGFKDDLLYWNADILIALYDHLINDNGKFYVDSHRGLLSLREMKDMRDDFALMVELTQKEYDANDIEKVKSQIKRKVMQDEIEMCCEFLLNGRRLK